MQQQAEDSAKKRLQRNHLSREHHRQALGCDRPGQRSAEVDKY
jgi:hypothetical protein